MDAEEIANRIALLFNPMPDMSGRQINRLHGERRRQVEELAADLAAESVRLRQELRLSEDQCNLFVEAFAEIKATDDGESDQPISAILAGCIEEMKGIKSRYAALAEPTAPR